MGFDPYRKTVGIVGTGQIGAIVAQILNGFGCNLLAADPCGNPARRTLGAVYVDPDVLLRQGDIVTLQCPVTPQTHQLTDADAVAKIRPGAMIIDSSLGGVVEGTALIAGLKSSSVGSVGPDVHEEEADLFIEDRYQTFTRDDVSARLLWQHHRLRTLRCAGSFSTCARRPPVDVDAVGRNAACGNPDRHGHLAPFCHRRRRAGLAVALLLSLAAFQPAEDETPALMLGGAAEAGDTTLTILWIILPALAIFEFQNQSGAIVPMRNAFAALTSQRRMQAILIAWFFGVFMEGPPVSAHLLPWRHLCWRALAMRLSGPCSWRFWVMRPGCLSGRSARQCLPRSPSRN